MLEDKEVEEDGKPKIVAEDGKEVEVNQVAGAITTEEVSPSPLKFSDSDSSPLKFNKFDPLKTIDPGMSNT